MKRLISCLSILCFFARLDAQCGFDVQPEERYLNRGNRHEGFIRSKSEFNEFKIYGTLPLNKLNVPQDQIDKLEELNDSDILKSIVKLKIVHFTYGEFKFAKKPSEEITLRAVNPNLSMKIFARDIAGNACYVMFASLTASAALNWPVSTVLLKKESTSDFSNIGVVGVALKQEDIIYYPLASETKLTNKALNENYFVIKLRPLGSLSSFKWQIDNEVLHESTDPISAGTPIIITLPRKNLNGNHKLNIYYKAVGEEIESSDSFSLFF
jgi:hypothetical protein